MDRESRVGTENEQLLSCAADFSVIVPTFSAAVCVAGSKLEATEGHDVSILFKTGLKRVDEVRIIFGESNVKRLCAQYCSPDAAYICDPVETSHLQVEEGNVSFILVKVNISSAGLYTAQAITDNVVYEVTATLVVNKAPVSSTSPPHSSSRPTPPRSSGLQWLYALIPLVIVVSGGVCFWKLRKKWMKRRRNNSCLQIQCLNKIQELEKPLWTVIV